MTMQSVIESLIKELGLNVDASSQLTFNEPQLPIDREQLIDAAKILLRKGVSHLSTITGLDVEGRCVLLYHFWHFGGLTLRITLAENNERIQSLTSLIPGVEFYEREVRDMFGVVFDGLQNTERMFLPDNWQGDPPMRERKPPQGKSADEQQDDGRSNE